MQFNRNKPTLTLVRGLPGSGKSTFAQLLGGLGTYSQEADFYFEGKDFNPAELPAAHWQCRDKTRDKLLCGWNVVVSNTSTTEEEIQTYQQMAKDCNANFVSLIVENRHNGASIHNVPETTIAKMRKRFSIKL
jgi:predicted kinase